MTLRSLTYAGFLHIRTHLRTCWSLLIDPLLMMSIHFRRPDVERISIRHAMFRWRGVGGSTTPATFAVFADRPTHESTLRKQICPAHHK